MNYKSILANLDKIESDVARLCDDEYPAVQPCMDVVEFSRLVDEAMQKQREQKDESQLFREIFNNSDYYENLSTYIEQMNRNIVRQAEQNGVYADVGRYMQSNLSEIDSLIELLKAEYHGLAKDDRKRFLKKNTTELEEIAGIVRRLAACEQNIAALLRYNSAVLANVILKNFKTLFTFFNNSIRVAKARQDELLLVEIAGLSDRLVSNIAPVLSGKSLSSKELIYHSLIYEFRRLKHIAIGD